MAEEEKQPRKIKDLKARLGRTIAPTTAAGTVTPPAGITPPPPSGVVAPPPFLQDDKGDPFAAAAAAQGGSGEVRIVIDESAALEVSEKSKKERTRAVLIAAGLTLVLGSVVGYGIGGSMSERARYNLAIQESKEIYAAVDSATEPLVRANELINRVVRKANEQEIDWAALEELRAIPNPFNADAFSGRDYSLFSGQAVNAIFSFYRETSAVFTQISAFAQKNLAAKGKERLEAALEAEKGMKNPKDSAFAQGFGWMQAQTGCKLTTDGPVPRCDLVYVDQPPLNEAGTELTSLTVKIGPTARSQTQERKIYTGQEDLKKKADELVILVNTPGSLGVLGERASAFTEFLREATRIKEALEEKVDKERIRAKQELDRIRKEEQL
ncbi:MAG: hypothetical protein GXY23_12725 [Myxococcales bacterium]|nr:hypothetical protein [Myxococcales bacterium]